LVIKNLRLKSLSSRSCTGLCTAASFADTGLQFARKNARGKLIS
jgi:hypothetical protein